MSSVILSELLKYCQVAWQNGVGMFPDSWSNILEISDFKCFVWQMRVWTFEEKYERVAGRSFDRKEGDGVQKQGLNI